MVEELGKIEKPEAEQFKGKRKLYLVPLIFSGKDAPPEYVERFNRYWEQASQHIANLESKMNKVSHVYHESIAMAGESGLEIMEKLNSASYQIVRDKCQAGAILEETEDKELAEETMDWQRCLFIGFVSQKVAKMVTEFCLEALRKRYDYIVRRIDDTLKPDEAGILFIQEGHLAQFPPDIEVFSVAPPALDEIRRWQRDRLSTEKRDEP